MAIAYEDFVPDVAVVVSGCPELAIKNAIRSSVVEFAERSEVTQVTKNLNVTAGQNTYTVPSGAAYIHKVLWVSYKGKEVEPVTQALLNDRVPGWSVDGETGDPKYYFTTGLDPMEIVLWPAPEAAEHQLKVHIVTKPTKGSFEAADDAMLPFKDTIVNGAIQRLFRIPNKAWSDLKAASVYQTLFMKGCEDAKKLNQPDRPIARRVNYGGLKQSTRFRNRGWRKGY
jgi:hypothetical protein